MTEHSLIQYISNLGNQDVHICLQAINELYIHTFIDFSTVDFIHFGTYEF